MKYLLAMFLLFCAFSVGHSLRCFSCNTEKLLCPPKIVTCPANENKCVSLTKDNFKFKGCNSEVTALMTKALFTISYKLYNRLDSPSSNCFCKTDLCNGSEKLSKKSQIVLTVAGVVFVLFKLF